MGMHTRTWIGIGILATVPIWDATALGQWRWQDWFRLPRLEPVRVRYWAEKLRTEKDPALRLEALRRLAEADPRVHGDVLPTLLATLRTDPSPALRQAAAETLGQYPTLFAQAGLALEEALEQDPVPAVQEAARQALWNYHLLGYRSSKGVGGFVGQTQEPPLAPQAVRSYSQVISSYSSETPAPLPAVRRVPSLWSSSLPPLLAPSPLSLGSSPSSVFYTTPDLFSSVGAAATAEPPLARTPPPLTSTVDLTEPPVRTVLREPPRTLQPPPIADALPPIVLSPDQIPGHIPLIRFSSEPPRASPPAYQRP
jgi:hypothetical protein